MFLAFWNEAHYKPVDAQIESWASEYMSQWPELLEKQLENYSRENVDWRQIAREKVFPLLSDRLQTMKAAHKNLLNSCGQIYSKAQEVLGFKSNLICVIYVGIGCGAGWATQYSGYPACLFGLENIAELKWHCRERLQGLIAHEIGHLVHMVWRNEWDSFDKAEQNPLFRLYSEGFAQRCEHLILGDEIWHEAQDDNWLLWCRQHQAWLAKEYLRRVDADIPVNDFFGSWFDIQGKRQTGYFLGHELVKMLRAHLDIKDIALLDDVDCKIAALLKQMAGKT